jgi:uncharacterized protein
VIGDRIAGGNSFTVRRHALAAILVIAMPDDPKPIDFAGLRAALDKHQKFPTRYVFKFIVPHAELPHLLALLDGLELSTRESATGKYTSVTAEHVVRTTDQVVEIYDRVRVVKGIRSF